MSRNLDFINLTVFTATQHLTVITLLCIWVKTNAGKMCSGDTAVLTTRARAQDLRAVRFLPSERERERESALMSLNCDNREVGPSPEAP